MTHKDFTKDVLTAIKDKHITPKPKWHFLLKDYSIWSLIALSFIVGSLAFSVVLYMIVSNDWDVYENINDSLIEFIFVTLPYFWIVLMGLFIFLVDYNLKHTKKGYKYNIYVISLGSVIGSIVVGTLFFNLGLGRIIDDTFVERVPYYKSFLGERHNRWAQPEEGMMGGIVIEISDTILDVKDRDGRLWTVDISKATYIDANIEEGSLIRIFGKLLDEDLFIAERVIRGEFGPGLRRFRENSMPLKHLPLNIERKIYYMRSS